MAKKLCKSQKNRVISGVCGGVAEYFNIDPTIVRLAVVILCFIKGFGILIYILACFIMPSAEETSTDYDDVENLKSAKVDFEDQSSQENKKNTSGKVFHTDDEFNEFFKEQK